MKKFSTFSLYIALGVITAFNFASCDDNNGSGDGISSEKDKAFEAIATQYVNNTVVITYKSLADNTEQLADKLAALKTAKTDANVKTVCDIFLAARAQWELSEAFLFGAASDFGIDPHIDSWPLDLNGLLDELTNKKHIEAMAAAGGDEWAGAKLGPDLLGFHGIEYIIFKDGAPRPASEITGDQLIYSTAVAGDLRNKCFQLEAAWGGEKGTTAGRYTRVVDELELKVNVNDAEYSYGENMKNAGQAGSTYKTWTAAVQAIVDGCKTIADEVGASKIGKPHTGEDKNYIESPYSHQSITDFYDNIRSIENAYMGGVEGKRGSSLHDYLAETNAALDKQVTEAIANAKSKIKAMKAPFVENYTDPSCQSAMDACKALDDVLTQAKAELAKE